MSGPLRHARRIPSMEAVSESFWRRGLGMNACCVAKNGKHVEQAVIERDHITKPSKNSKGRATRAGRRKGDTSTKLRFAKKIRL